MEQDYTKAESFLGLPRKISELLKKESDRGAILIMAAYLDEILGQLIRANVCTENDADELLKYGGAAGEFSSRIAVCRAFGVISPDEAQALTHIRKIRNKAAHFEAKGRGFDVLFDSEETANLVAALGAALLQKLESREPERVRKDFVFFGRSLAIRLYFRLLLSSPSPIPLSQKAHAEKVREKLMSTPDGQEVIKQLNEEVAKGDIPAIFKWLLNIRAENKKSE